MGSSRNSPSIDATSFARGLLRRLLVAAPDRGTTPFRVVVAYSGGLDSTVLLHALSFASSDSGLPIELSAIHIHHGLSPNADAWASQCVRFCAQLGVPLLCRQVNVEQQSDGLEAAARRARYAVYEELPADLIVLGHHQDDQAETLMLNLLRGTSVLGGAAIPLQRGRFIRPLLGVPRSDLRAYAQSTGLNWIEDESNANPRFTRNFLRTEILPRLQDRFPQASANLAHAATGFAEARLLLDELAVLDGGAEVPLPLASLRCLSRTRAANAFAYHLRLHEVRIASRAWLLEALEQLLDSRSDCQIHIRADGKLISRYRDQLILRDAPATTPDSCRWSEAFPDVAWGASWIKANSSEGAGIAKSRLKGDLEFRARRGGERFEVRPGLRRKLKDLMREAGLAPWQRRSLPLLFCNGELVWVPFVGISEKFRCQPEEEGISLEFDEASW